MEVSISGVPEKRDFHIIVLCDIPDSPDHVRDSVAGSRDVFQNGCRLPSGERSKGRAARSLEPVGLTLVLGDVDLCGVMTLTDLCDLSNLAIKLDSRTIDLNEQHCPGRGRQAEMDIVLDASKARLVQELKGDRDDSSLD